MNEVDGYDVLRLIQHNKSCYVSSEYVEGKPLIQWLKYHPCLSKEQLFLWFHELAKQLEYIHRCRGNPCYRYMNPYSIIITEEKTMHLLDMSAQSNEKTLLLIQRRNVREHFLPPDEAYYQTESIALDIYGLGKTIQYLLSVSQPEPGLTGREQMRLQKIILKSLNRQSNRAYHQVSELRRQLPVYHKIENHCTTKNTVMKKIVISAFFIIGVLVIASISSQIHEGKEGSGERKKNSRQAEETVESAESANDTFEQNELRKELGFVYFLDKKNYGMSRKYFSEISGDRAAEKMADLAECMEQMGRTGGEEELLDTLSELEEEIPEDDSENYYRCLIEGYRRMDTEKAAEAVIRLSERVVSEDAEIQGTLTGYAAAAYERVGDDEKAIEKYKDILAQEREGSVREELYKKLTVLYEESGERNLAGEVCRQGIRELKESKKLRLMYIRMQCSDETVDRNVCAQTIQEYIQELPGLKDEEEFKKLQQEYGIVLEGDSVWVGR